LTNQLPFVRDRIVENYFWTVGLIYEPQFGYIRRIMTIVNALVTTIDDIYDIYGTLEELELFTSMVEKLRNILPFFGQSIGYFAAVPWSTTRPLLQKSST